jgi:ribonuclease HI
MKKANDLVLFVYADASVQPAATGLGVVIKNVNGKLIAWRSKPTRPMTCNEAEYAALILALEEARWFNPTIVHVYSDSRLVVEQMHGWISVTSPLLRPLHQQARRLKERFKQITFTHIPREWNQLADALAEQALANATPGMVQRKSRIGNWK